VIDKLFKAALSTFYHILTSIVNKLSKTNKKVGNDSEDMPELLTFKSFKSRATQNFEKMMMQKQCNRLSLTYLVMRKHHKNGKHESL